LADQHMGAAPIHCKGLLTMPDLGTRAFSASCRETMVVERPDPENECFVVEQLRVAPLFSVPCFEVLNITASIEDGCPASEASSVAAVWADVTAFDAALCPPRLKQNEKNRHHADTLRRASRRTITFMFNTFLKGAPS